MTDQLFHIRWPQDQATVTHRILLCLVIAGGAALRFWGLGNIGLHGDEDVMGLATRGLLETGWPILPSGMDYVRGLPQLYLMAASTHIFGDTEWALRLPSVLVGTLGIYIAYLLARRFLSANWSIVFAVVFALLPSMISLSQTARMYGFYVTLVMLFAIAIFRWERTASVSAYIIAVAACLLSLSLHALAVFSTLLFLYPGLVKMSWRLLGFGFVAIVLAVIFQQEHSAWVGSHYFELVKVEPGPGDVSDSRLLARRVGLTPAVLIVLTLSAAALTVFVFARRQGRTSSQTLWLALAAPCLAGAVILGPLYQYHLAGVLLVLGTVFFVRAGNTATLPVILAVLLIALFGVQAYLTWQSPDVNTLNDLLEVMAGKPYPKTYLTFIGFAPFGVVTYGIVATYFLAQFARGMPLPDHVLFFLVSVLAPLFLMGFLANQYVPGRYVVGFLPFFILSVFAGISELLYRYHERLPARQSMVYGAIPMIVLLLVFVNPRHLWYNVNPRSEDFRNLTDSRGVDHKGAAEFVFSQSLGPNDLVMSVDPQQQVYYLGKRVDYYLRSLLVYGRNSSILRDGKMLCLYTGTPQISTGDELARILSEPKPRQVLIIDSAESVSNRMRYMGDGIWETMRDFGVEEVYLGRDGATQVWRYVARSR